MLLLPSQLPNKVQQRVWDVYDHVATTLIEQGYDNTFFNIQVRSDNKTVTYGNVSIFPLLPIFLQTFFNLVW